MLAQTSKSVQGAYRTGGIARPISPRIGQDPGFAFRDQTEVRHDAVAYLKVGFRAVRAVVDNEALAGQLQVLVHGADLVANAGRFGLPLSGWIPSSVP